jgi:hypothetical protein
MSDWPLNDANLLPLVLSCFAVIIVGLIAHALTRVRRAEFARLQNEVEKLSESVRALQGAEERRFLVELKSNNEVAASATKVAPISESRPADLQIIDTRKEA